MILVIGLDGYPWAWEARLRDIGFCTAPLYSPHAQSAPAWNSLMSGLRAETHRYEGLPMAGVRDTGGRIRYIWDHLLASGKQTMAVGVPFIFPPMLLRLHACGYPADSENYIYPKERAQAWPWRIIDLCNAYHGVGAREFHVLPDEELLATARASRHYLAHRLRCELERSDRPDLAIACWTDVDRLSHAAYASMQKPEIRDGVVDELLGIAEKLVAIYAPDWTFVISDHGLDLEQDAPTMEGDDFWRQTHGPDMPNTRYGIFAYQSAGTAQAMADGTEVQVEDVVPTLLYLLDAPPVGRIDGKALTEIIGDEAVDEVATRARLEQLGYI